MNEKNSYICTDPTSTLRVISGWRSFFVTQWIKITRLKLFLILMSFRNNIMEQYPYFDVWWTGWCWGMKNPVLPWRNSYKISVSLTSLVITWCLPLSTSRQSQMPLGMTSCFLTLLLESSMEWGWPPPIISATSARCRVQCWTALISNKWCGESLSTSNSVPF